MAIVPYQYGLPTIFPGLSFPTIYRPFYGYPTVYSPFETMQPTQRILSYYDPYLGSIYNPGNFWIWPFGK